MKTRTIQNRTLKRAARRRVNKAGSKWVLRAGSKRKRVHKVASTKKVKQKPLTVKIRDVDSLSNTKVEKIDHLIKSSFENSGIQYVDKDNECVFVSIGTEIIGVLFLRPSDDYGRASADPSVDHVNDATNNAYSQTIGNNGNQKMRDALSSSSSTSGHTDSIYIHTACVSDGHRGKGVLHKMLYFISTLPRFKNVVFKLEASNTVEHATGLNQAVRFQIYSKAGFTLPVGTVIEPGGEMVVRVEAHGQSRWTQHHRSIVYALRSRDGVERVVSFQDIRPTACYMNSIKQERGCLMESDSLKLRDFNYNK
jgi:hypothetical protein